MRLAGFVDFEITWRAYIYDGAAQEGPARNFGTKGITFRARKRHQPQAHAKGVR